MKDIDSLKKYLKNKIKQCEITLSEKDLCDFVEKLNPKFKEASDKKDECYAAIRMIKEFNNETRNK